MRSAMRPQSEPHMRTAYATDGRTNERRTFITDVDHLTAVDARENDDEISTLGQVINDGVMPTGQRHDVIRLGERQPIPGHVRSAVWFRDHGKCELCGDGRKAKPWELDHITPWSAGGADTSTNLRVLCKTHNQERSNYADPFERPRMAATWWCLNCYGGDMVGEWWSYLPGGVIFCPIHRGSPRCNVIRSYRWLFDNDDEPPTWHERPPVEQTTATAWCAHCGAPGLTDQPL